jgi:hypothetical protein
MIIMAETNSRCIYLTKSEKKENINFLNRTITSNEIEAVVESPLKKSQDQMNSMQNSIRLLRTSTNTHKNLPENLKGKDTTKLIV